VENKKLVFEFYKRKWKLFFRSIRMRVFRLIHDKGIGNIEIGEDFIREKNIKKIAVVTTSDRIGDLLVKTPIFREIKKKDPNIKISLLVKNSSAKDIVIYNKNIDEFIEYDKKNLNKIAKKIKSENYDLMVHLTNEIKESDLKFIKKCSVKYLFGMNKKDWKIFNITVEEGIEVKRDAHISQITKLILSKFGIKNADVMYDLYLDEDREKKVKELKKEFADEKVIVINPYSAKEYRSFNLESIKKILEITKDYKRILLYYGNKDEELRKIAKNYTNVIVPEEINSILDSVVYIKIADLVITPDTGIVHISSICNKKLIVVYASPKKETSEIIDYKVWAPLSEQWRGLYINTKNVVCGFNHKNIDINNVDFSELEITIREYCLKKTEK